MTINLSQIGPAGWIALAAFAAIILFVVIRFFWHYVIRFVLRIGAVLLVIVALLALLHYLKVF